MGRINVSVTKDLNKFKNRVSKKIKVDNMILFGSQAKGKTHKWSDIDLILVSPDFKRKRWLKRAPQLYQHWDYNHPLDLFCYTPEEFKKLKKNSIIIKEAIKNGRQI